MVGGVHQETRREELGADVGTVHFSVPRSSHREVDVFNFPLFGLGAGRKMSLKMIHFSQNLK